MNHLDFIVWMIGFPVSQAAIEWLKRDVPSVEYDDGVGWIAATALILLWLGIGWALF